MRVLGYLTLIEVLHGVKVRSDGFCNAEISYLRIVALDSVTRKMWLEQIESFA